MSDQPQSESVPLGSSDLRISPLGIGTWAWGDRLFWGYGRGYSDADLQAAFQAGLTAGVNFFDTAEIYGRGSSERLLGQFVSAADQPVVVATKFWPFPWRLRREDILHALRGSLDRLGLNQVDLYQIHQPFRPVSIETWMAGLADAVEAGLTRAVGVSNYDVDQMRRAHAALAQRGVHLVANQVAYSLLNRRPERSGLLEACRELGITLIAYSPLAQGLLTGKYTPQNKPPAVRRIYAALASGSRLDRQYLAQIQPLIALLWQLGEAHGGKTPAQVALNWVICKGAVPIPGVKNVRQARDNVGALGWHLTDGQVAALDAVSEKLQR